MKTNRSGPITLIKLGGSLLDDAGRRAVALGGIAERWKSGTSLVLVHGGGKHIDKLLSRLGLPTFKHAGLRITDSDTMEVVVSALAGSVNKMLVAELTALGVRAAGISGIDAGTIMAERLPLIDGVNLGSVGRVTVCDPSLVASILGSGTLPVVAPVAIDNQGHFLNVNADSAAASLSAAMGASSLEFLTDVDGVRGPSGKSVPLLDSAQVDQWIDEQVVTGGMLPKLQAARYALEHGVSSIRIGEGSGGTQLVASTRSEGGTDAAA